MEPLYKNSVIKKVLIIIGGVFLLTAVSSWIITMTQKETLSLPNFLGGKPAQREVAKTAVITLQPISIDAVDEDTVKSTVDILVNTGGASINGVQVDLSFDPNTISNVAVTTPLDASSLFGKQSEYFVVTKKINQNRGTILYAVGLAPRVAPKSGANSIGRITMNVKKGNTTGTQVTFSSKTLVTVRGSDSSVLKTTVPLPITFE